MVCYLQLVIRSSSNAYPGGQPRLSRGWLFVLETVIISSMYYFYIFIFGGFLGWILDTAFRSLQDKRYSPGTLIPFFSIIYGAGAVVLDVLFVYAPLAAYLQVLVGAVLAVLLELLSGLIALAVLKRRLWNYETSRFNYRGFIDLQHSLYWLLLIAAYRAAYQFFR